MHGGRNPTTKHQPQHHQAQKLPASDVGSVTSDLCVRAFAATVSIKLRFSLTIQYLPRRKHPSRLSKRRSALCHPVYEFSELFFKGLSTSSASKTDPKTEQQTILLHRGIKNAHKATPSACKRNRYNLDRPASVHRERSSSNLSKHPVQQRQGHGHAPLSPKDKNAQQVLKPITLLIPTAPMPGCEI